jgi:hypothetical protein
MAKKRYAPAAAQVLGEPTLRRDKSVPNYTLHGASKVPIGPDPLQALSRAMAGFNPALAQYAKQRQEAASIEAEGLYNQMAAGVTDNSVAVKKILKDAGFSQWANPYVYRNQLGNLGANQAYRDAAALTSNAEFSTALHELSKTSDNFYQDAQSLTENWKDRLFTRDAEDKKTQTYFNMGYASKWLTAREQLLKPFVEQNTKWQQGKIRADFYESGQNILRNAIFSQDKNGNPVGNLKPLRRFVSDQFGGFPDDEIGYNRAVWDNIVKPVFLQLAIDPDNEILISKAYDKVQKLTRDTGSGRTQVFKQLRVEMDVFYQTLEDTMQKAQSTQSGRDRDRRSALLLSITDTLKSWNTGEPLKKFDPENKAFEVRGITYPFTPEEAKKVTNFLYKQPDFRVNWKDNAIEGKIAFNSVAQAAHLAVSEANRTKYATKEAENKAYMESWERQISDHDIFNDLFSTYRRGVFESVGSIDLSRADSVKAALEKFTGDELEKLWYEEHHDMAPGTAPLLATLQRVLANKGDAYSIERATQLMHIAQAAIKDGKVTDELLSELQDAQVEVNDPQADKELKALYDTALNSKGLGKWYKIGEGEAGMLTDIWKGLGIDAEEVKAVYDYKKTRGGSGLTVELTPPSEEERYAANESKLWLDDQIARVWREEVTRAMGRLPHTARDDEWDSGLKDKIKKNVIERVSGMARNFNKFHQEALNSHEADTLSDVKALNLMLDKEDQSRVATYTHLETMFGENVEGLSVIADPTLHADPNIPGDLRVAYQDNAEDFFTGVAGTAHWNNLHTMKSENATRSATLLTSLHKAFIAQQTAQATGALTYAARKDDYKKAQDKFKGHALMMGVHDWRDWETDNREDYKLTVSMKGENLDIPLHIANDHINMSSVLVFPNLEGMEDVANMMETWEGGDPTAWLNRDDASEELQRFARFFSKAHGIDLLSPDPVQRRKDEPKIAKLWERQATMMITRHPDRMPQKLFKALEYRQIDNYIDRKDDDGNEWTTYQGKEFSLNDKRWVTGMRMQNRTMLSGKFTQEKGFKTGELMQNVLALTGGTVAEEPYDLSGMVAPRHQNLPGAVVNFLDKSLGVLQSSVLNDPESVSKLEYLIPDDNPMGSTRFKEFFNVGETVNRKYDMVRKELLEKNSHLAFKGKKREVLAQELAMANRGVSHPTKYNSHPQWSGGVGDQKRAAIKVETKRILGLLKEGEKKRVPELAVLYNKLIARFGSDKEYFIAPSSTGIRRTENVWGLTAIPVPSVPLETAASKKASLINKDVWPWSDDFVQRKPLGADDVDTNETQAKEYKRTLEEKALGFDKEGVQRIPIEGKNRQTDAEFLKGEKSPDKVKPSEPEQREKAVPNLSKEYKLEEEHLKAVETFKKVEVPKILKEIQDKNIKKVMDEVMEGMKQRDFDKAKLKYINALEEGVKSGKLKPIKAEAAVKRFEELQRQLKNKR